MLQIEEITHTSLQYYYYDTSSYRVVLRDCEDGGWLKENLKKLTLTVAHCIVAPGPGPCLWRSFLFSVAFNISLMVKG